MRATKGLLLVIATIVGGNAGAHKDRPIELTSAGELRGLPKQYQPARLELSNTDQGRVSLQLGKASTVFPECISQFFRRADRNRIWVTASWYHDPSHLPYYLNIRLEESGSDDEWWSLLISLDSANVLFIDHVVVTDGGNGRQHDRIDPTEICTPEEQSQLIPRAAN